MKKLIFLLLCTISFADSFSQLYQSISTPYRYRWFIGDSAVTIPRGSTPSLNGTNTEAGKLFFRTTDSTVVVWTGSQFIPVARASTITLQQAIDNGDEFNKNNTLNANGYDFKIDNLKSFVLDSLENTFLYSDTKGVFTITNIEGGVTQKLQFENQPGHFTISHANGNPFVKFDRGDSSIKMYNSSTLAVRDTIAYLRDVRASGGGADSAIYKTVWRARQDSLVHVAAINFKINKSDSAVGGYYPYSSNPLGYITSASVPAAANPSTSVGLSAVNGSATTFMRSDAAPALSQSITPTWTGLHTFNPTLNASTGVGRSVLINGVITATANNDRLFGLDIKPTLNTGGFTGVVLGGARVASGSSGASDAILSLENNSGTEIIRFRNNGQIVLSSSTGTNAYTLGNSSGGAIFTLSSLTAGFGGVVSSVNSTTVTSGDNAALSTSTAGSGFAPTSGTASYTFLRLNGTINQTGTASGSIRGIYYNPTLTSVLGTHTAYESTTGNTLIGTTSGSVGIGANTSINASAILDITSTSKGVLLPRMTGIQAEAISSPADGLLIYCNNGNGSTINSTGFWGYTGGWVKLN